MTYGKVDLSQHQLRWWHQAITWNNVDLSLIESLARPNTNFTQSAQDVMVMMMVMVMVMVMVIGDGDGDDIAEEED